MPDLNKSLAHLQNKSHKIKEELKGLLIDYENIFREINGIYLNEKMASKSIEGLEDFYHLLQTVRRNRDVIGSLMKGFSGMRSMDKFKFIEEDVPEEPKKKKATISDDNIPGLQDLMAEKVEEVTNA